MLVKIGEVVRQVALITLLAAFLEMLLPGKKITHYVRLVLGLFVVVAIITPVVEDLRIGPELDVAAWDLRLNPVRAAPIETGKEMAEETEAEAINVYKERLAGQIKSLVTLVPGIESAEVLVDINEKQGYLGAVKRVVVTANTKQLPSSVQVDGIEINNNNEQSLEEIPSSEETEPVKIDIKETEKRVSDIITHFYGLDFQQVEVQVLPNIMTDKSSGGGGDESK